VVAKLPRDPLDITRYALVTTGNEAACTDSHVLLETGQSCYECTTAKRRETQFDLIADAEEKPAGHPHAALMALYAQDAAETAEPWERWECFGSMKEWMGICSHPNWGLSNQYRRKPRTIKIGDCKIPAPERVAPAVGSPYWIVGISHGDCLVEELEWDDDASDNFFLKKGIVHLNPESAVAHGEALIALTATK